MAASARPSRSAVATTAAEAPWRIGGCDGEQKRQPHRPLRRDGGSGRRHVGATAAAAETVRRRDCIKRLRAGGGENGGTTATCRCGGGGGGKGRDGASSAPRRPSVRRRFIGLGAAAAQQRCEASARRGYQQHPGDGAMAPCSAQCRRRVGSVSAASSAVSVAARCRNVGAVTAARWHRVGRAGAAQRKKVGGGSATALGSAGVVTTTPKTSRRREDATARQQRRSRRRADGSDDGSTTPARRRKVKWVDGATARQRTADGGPTGHR